MTMDEWKDETLNVNAALEIAEEIYEAKNKSELLGRKLKIPKCDVESILTQYSKPEDRLFHVIEEFLKQVEPRPTWRAILDALNSRLIALPHVVKEIERNHSPTESVVQGKNNHFT